MTPPITIFSFLIKILDKYGAPPKFVAAIKTMYTGLKVLLKINKETWKILQSVGVRQGNNMAPVLFLFLMLAAVETLELEWKKRESMCSLSAMHLMTNSIPDASEGIYPSDISFAKTHRIRDLPATLCQ